MNVLKPVSVAVAAASLLGLASLTPVLAQTGYPAPQGVTPGTNLPYPGPQYATPNTQSTYPAARPGYAAAPMETGYPAPPPQSMDYPAVRTGYVTPGTNTQLVTNGPQANVEEQQPNWSVHQNVVQSHHYTRLIQTDRAFREARMRKECGPITDPQLHSQCMASFDRYNAS